MGRSSGISQRGRIAIQMEEGEKTEPTLTGEDIRLIHSLANFQQVLSALTFIDELEPDQKMTRVELRRYAHLVRDDSLALFERRHE